jgi:hypothetical protein
VTAARVILVSDTHLSPAAPEAEANWEAVLGYAGAAAPDLGRSASPAAAGRGRSSATSR